MKRIQPPEGPPLRRRLYQIVFHANDPVSKAFDVFLILAIIASVAVVMLDSVDGIEIIFGEELRLAEWVFTVIFTAEYLVRLWVVRKPSSYAFSFFGIVDFLSVVPTYLSLFIAGAEYLLVVRILRVLRVFRVLKLATYLDEAETLGRALSASRRKIAVFIFVVLTVVTVMGSLMYVVEGGENGFDSIPRSVYWAVVTLTTVGYGDISPATPLGQAIALVIMVMGYGIIAVPTGIVSVELSNEVGMARRRRCPDCQHAGHDADAQFCKRCGCTLPELGEALATTARAHADAAGQ